ncbi:hypothetical protein [Elongatibacter sediminis]|uniref:Glycosyltransferase RgtA/B/C/D-like domain-containing protein n=1 Tax=Elongatibacter sediminis TaxID=3119006 RepID=A0AAW9RKR6_9GAMM
MDWVENGLSPWVDHYSFTFQGEEIKSPPVAFQVALWSAVDLLGERGGFVTVKLVAFLLTLGLMGAWLKQIRAPVIAWLIVLPLMVCLLQLRAQIRPELFSYAVSIVALMLYHRTRLRLTLGAIGPVALLLWIWTNYHSPIIGYVIFFGLFIDIAWRLIKEKGGAPEWAKWAGWGIVLVGVGFLNASLSHPVIGMLRFPAEWKFYIQEYGPPLAHLHFVWFYVLMAVAVLTLALSVKQRRIGYLLISVVLIYGAITMARMVAPAGLVVLAILAHLLADAWQSRRTSNQPSLPSWTVYAAVVLVLIPLLSGVQMARDFMRENRTSWSRFPDALVQHMIDNDLQGRIFNAYPMGGYLIWRLAPASQVYIDGRTNILYPLSHYIELLESRAVPQTLRETTDRYAIDWAVVEDDPYTLSLFQDAGYELEFADVEYVLLRHGPGTFELTGRLAAQPWCWNAGMEGRVRDELAQAVMQLPGSASMQGPLHLAAGFVGASNRVDWLNSIIADRIATDYARRFLIYRNLEYGLIDNALNLLSAVEVRSPRDYLTEAFAQIQGGDYRAAEQAVDAALRHRWVYIDYADVFLQYLILREIRRAGPFQVLDDQILQDLEKQIGDGPRKQSGPLTTAAFCASG